MGRALNGFRISWQTLIVGLIVAMATTAMATPPRCERPADARPLARAAERHRRLLVSRLKATTSIGRSLSVDRYCLSTGGIWISEAWLPANKFSARGTSSSGQLAFAYLIGAHRFLFGTPMNRRHQTLDEAGAWAAGCALGRSMLRGAPADRLIDELSALTTPHTNAARFRRVVEEGSRSCAR